MPLVDIIIPLYNKQATVERTIRSIQNQSFQDWQAIVVDDGSTDDSFERVRKINDDRIVLIQQANKGPGAARNTGINRATSKYIAFLDADDEWYPWYLKNAIHAIETNDVALVGTMYYDWPNKNDRTQFWAKRGVHPGIRSVCPDDDSQSVESLILFFHVGASLLYTATARKYDGFYDKDFCRSGEDLIFFVRIVMNEPVMILTPPAVCHHLEDSDLSQLHSHPLPIFSQPECVLNYCPEEKLPLMRKTLDRLALRSARRKAREGFKSDAAILLQRFPQAKSFTIQYYRCRCEIAFNRWFFYWVKFKRAVGPPTRLFLSSMADKFRPTSKIPDLPPEKISDE